MSRSRKFIMFGSVAAVAVAVAAAVTVAQDKADGVRIYGLSGNQYVAPKSEIINYDDTVALFDTSNGAIYKYNGNLRDPNTTGQWRLEVKAVDGATSGLLEIQHGKGVENLGGTFLVDVINGRTWILHRHPNSQTANWDEVKIFR
jgi:hypothetical protein